MTVKSRMAALLWIFVLMTSGASAQSAEDWRMKGLNAFRMQKNDEAIVYFEKARSADSANDEYPLYLGILYQGAGRFESAEAQYSAGLAQAGPKHDQLLLNRANLRFSQGNIEGAREDYSKLIEGSGSMKPSALLNMANMELNSAQYSDALSHYSSYLSVEPNSPQRETIETIIGMLGARIASETEAKLVAEEMAKREEEARLAEIARMAEEKARREALMKEVFDSLSGSGEETKSISAGSETLMEDFEESELED